MHPLQVASLNTPEALNYFWGLDYIDEVYFADENPDRYQLYETVAATVAGLLPVAPPYAILDAGCGPGKFFSVLKRTNPVWQRRLYGLDYAESAIVRARDEHPDGIFLVGDLLDPPTLPEKMAVVVCLEVLEHLETPDRALANLKKMVRAGGKLVLTVPNGELDRYPGHRQFWDFPAFFDFVKQHARAFSLRTIRGGTNFMAIMDV